MGWADGFMEKAEGCRAAAGTLERVLPYSRPALLSQEDKARTVFLLQLGQANPDQGAVIYHVAGELPSATLTGTQSFFCLSGLCQVPH